MPDQSNKGTSLDPERLAGYKAFLDTIPVAPSPYQDWHDPEPPVQLDRKIEEHPPGTALPLAGGRVVPSHHPAACAEAFGPGPEGWRCGSCANLQAVSVEGATVYYCCIDGGARHVTSPACSRFEEAPLAGEPTAVSSQQDAARPFGRPEEMTHEEIERRSDILKDRLDALDIII